jgi:hypothetical protein
MTNYEQIKAFLLAKYRAEASGEQVLITFEYDDQRSQLLAIESFSAMQNQWLCLRTRVCRRDSLPAEKALIYNAQLVFGHLALQDDHYVLISNHMIANLGKDELQLAMRTMAQTADEFEAALEGGSDNF